MTSATPETLDKQKHSQASRFAFLWDNERAVGALFLIPDGAVYCAAGGACPRGGDSVQPDRC